MALSSPLIRNVDPSRGTHIRISEIPLRCDECLSEIPPGEPIWSDFVNVCRGCAEQADAELSPEEISELREAGLL